MPASTATSAAASRPVVAMDPTTTEHDFRFPRRPGADHDADDHDPGDALVNGDFNRAHHAAAANDDLLGPALFPSLLGAGPDAARSVDQMQDDDPLATQVWKFFKATKHQLPNQQRMENLTWRMMALNMRRQKQEEELQRRGQLHQSRYVATSPAAAAISVPAASIVVARNETPALTRGFSLPPRSLANQAAQNTPSGIAQLRKTSANHAGAAEPMNLDDFIFSDRADAPAGFMSPPPLPSKSADDASASAIPISKSSRDSASHFVPQSVPHHQRSGNDEFNYVTRHHRKTSIDERRVSVTRPNPVLPALPGHGPRVPAPVPATQYIPSSFLFRSSSRLRLVAPTPLVPAPPPQWSRSYHIISDDTILPPTPSASHMLILSPLEPEAPRQLLSPCVCRQQQHRGRCSQPGIRH